MRKTYALETKEEAMSHDTMSRLESVVHEMQLVQCAMQDILLQSNLVSSDKFASVLHRKRFDAVCLAHHCSWECSILDAVRFVAPFLSPGDACRVHHASRSVAAGTREEILALKCRHAAVYVSGGFDGQVVLSSLERLDLGSASWRALPPMSRQRRNATAAAMNGRLYVCGGRELGEVLRCVERFDPEAGSWQQALAMSQRRCEAPAAVHGGGLCLLGGSCGSSSSKSLCHAERLTSGGRSWTPLPNLQLFRSGAVAAVVGGRLYVVGGHDGGRALGSVERMEVRGRDGAADWEILPPMAHQRADAMGVVVGSRLFVCGGRDGREFLSSVECLDTAGAGTWQSLPPMLQPRAASCAVAVAGLLYVCGGMENERRETTSTVEKFDFAAGCWLPAPSMLQRRRFATAVAAADRLYVCGGFDDQFCLDTAEFLADDGWHSMSPMVHRRAGAQGLVSRGRADVK